jgi:hypothetical protein
MLKKLGASLKVSVPITKSLAPTPFSSFHALPFRKGAKQPTSELSRPSSPKNRTLAACVGQWAAIALITPALPLPRPPISPPPKSSSIASSPPKNAKILTTDLKDFYLGTPMARYEYMRVLIHMIPDTIMDLYKLHNLVHNGHVYAEIRKGMYGLPQAGKIANARLTKFLEPYGYIPTGVTPGLWKHQTRDIFFTLVVDDFAVKYTDVDDATHLLTTLELYVCKTDWSGTRYCGLTLKWDYVTRTCEMSKPGYIERALQRFQHLPPTRPQPSPHAWQKPNYGAKTQCAPLPDTSTPLDAAGTKHMQEVLGTLLYYARAIDSTMSVAISTLASQQAHGTNATMIALTQLLNYAATNPEATILYSASDMVLHVSSDASYLTAPKARSHRPRTTTPTYGSGPTK